MEIIGQRLKVLRESVGLSQNKIAKMMGLRQSSVNRYETGESTPSPETFLWYADYFDVSMDYIYGRTEEKQGKLYDCKPKLEKSYPEMEQFIEMCFDPGSPMNKRLKDTLKKMLKEETT